MSKREKEHPLIEAIKLRRRAKKSRAPKLFLDRLDKIVTEKSNEAAKILVNSNLDLFQVEQKNKGIKLI